MRPSEPLPHFVEDYLRYLQEVHPTVAALDGVHAHDDLLEDLGRAAVEADARTLAGFARRLSEIGEEGLTATERVEHPILAANIQARMFEAEDIRTWERNPHLYADILASSLASQALFEHAPETERARRVLSKLRQTPRLIQAARDNVKDPPGIFVKVAIETFRGILTFLERDLPRAFSTVDDLHLLGDLADASTEAAHVLEDYVGYLEREQGPRARASFRLGRERLERKLKLEEGLPVNVDRLLAIAQRELAATHEEFRRTASRLNGGDPLEVWRATKADHPAAGQLAAAAREQVGQLAAFIERHRLVTLPSAEPVVVQPTPDFYRWSFASMWSPGPFEPKPTRAYYYVTDVDKAWSPERQEEHLRDFNFPTLWSISMHEVYPGHFLQFQHLRRVESKVRKSLFFAPASFMEGWAHYAEQVMMEAGFARENQALRLGQLHEALIRLVRLIVGIRLHAEDLSVEQGVRMFRDDAFLEESTARREAERGAFDPSYVVYAAGKLMLLKLRQDYKAREGSKFSLRTFHDTLLAQGAAPFWAHRRLLLNDATGDLLD
jgi:uncharacterized protein (DUF885 family)